MNHQTIRDQAAAGGLLPPLFLPLRTWQYREERLPPSLLADPREALPQARCMVAFLLPYSPFLPREQEPSLSAYYMASNALYHFCRNLSLQAQSEGQTLLSAPLAAKGMLAQQGIARIGKNSLAALPYQGSRFAVQWMLSAELAPQIDHDIDLATIPSCEGCQACARACPVGAIDEEGLHVERCLRYHLEGGLMPDWVKKNISSLTGCEICQQACPRNANISAIRTPAVPHALFSFGNILSLDTQALAANKKHWSALLGKNMLSKGRLFAQALCLAAHQAPQAYIPAAQHYLAHGNPLQQDAARFYLDASGA